MSIRQVVKTVAVSSAAVACSGVLMLGIGASSAGASTLANGPTSLTTQGTVTAGTPYSSGQIIDVVVAANSTMSQANLAAAGAPTTGNFYVAECTDTNGVLPTTSSGCEDATINPGALKTPDGHLSLTGANGFTVYDLPDTATLGQGNMVGTCDVAPNTCVLGIFAANPGINGFSYPHLFSAPFQMTVGDGTDAGNSPGDGTPEVPLAIGLPVAAVAVFGGWSIRNRRRRQQQAA